MPAHERLAQPFEEHRQRLRAVAYRMLGSIPEAEDAVQEAWIRLSRAEASEIANLGGWLTTVVARVCLDMLRARASRKEASLDVHVPDPIITRAIGGQDAGPEPEAMLADSIGLALLVVLEELDPAERVAFVLHDVFAMPFDEIAPVVGRSLTATRQLASRARRRVRSRAPASDADRRKQRRVVDAFLAAARDGNFEALLAVLDPDIVLRADAGALKGMSRVVRGAREIAGQASTFAKMGLSEEIVLVNGNIGVISRRPDGHVFSVVGFTVANGKVVEMDILADPERLARLDLPAAEQ